MRVYSIASRTLVACGAVAALAAWSVCGQGAGIGGTETLRERMERERSERQEQHVQRNRPEQAETAEGRVARLRRELEAAERAAERAAEARAVQARQQMDSFDSVEIPTGALVVVSSSRSEGSGFIARIRERTFFVTNIHVLGAAEGARFTTIDGQTVLLPSTAFLSKDRDIAIAPIEWDGPVLEVSQSLIFDEVAIGQPVTVMGNTSGARVVTRLEGHVRGLGPDEIEVSARFEPGNSGSPIVHNKLGTVIGVASHMRDLSVKDKWTRDSRMADIRRFGYRLDGEIQWEQYSLRELHRQATAFERFKERTLVMGHISHMLEHESRLVTSYRDHESIGYLFANIEDNFDWRRGTTSSNNQRLLKRLVDGLIVELQSDRKGTDDLLTIPFYRQQFLAIESSRDLVSAGLRRFSSMRL